MLLGCTWESAFSSAVGKTEHDNAARAKPFLCYVLPDGLPSEKLVYLPAGFLLLVFGGGFFFPPSFFLLLLN